MTRSALARDGGIGQAGHDRLQLGFVGDALEVAAGRVGLFQRSEFRVFQFDVERGDRVVDLPRSLAPTSGAVTTGLLCSQASATWAR